MWKFESYNTEFIKDISNILYIYKDFQFRLNHIEEEKKVVVNVFYKEKYVDSFSYEYIKDDFYLRKEKVLRNELCVMVDFFHKQNFLFIQKRIIQIEKHKYISLWFCCYDKSMKKILYNDEMEYRVTSDKLWERDKKWWLYLYEKRDNELMSSNQYFISKDWIEKVLDNWKRSFWWVDLLSQIKQLKEIHKKALYTIYQDNNLSWHRLFWTVIILIKELLEFTQQFFWNDYEVDLWEINKNRYDEVEKYLVPNYTLYLKVTKKSNSIFWFITMFKEQKFKDYQRKVLEKFPQLLQTYFSKKNSDEDIDLEKQYCSFNIMVKEDWELANLRDVEDVLYYKDTYNYNGFVVQPTFLISYISPINSLERSFITKINSSKELDKWEKLKIFYDVFSNKDNFIRQSAKYFLDNKNEEIIEKNILLYQIDELNKKYGKWNYIISYQHNEYVKFLKENWETIYSLSKEDWIFKKAAQYNNFLFLSFYSWNGIFCLQISSNNYILLDLIHLNYSIIRFSRGQCWEINLTTIWDKGLLYDMKANGFSLFRLSKDCIKEDFKFNLNKLPLWINKVYKDSFFLFYRWVKWISDIIKKYNALRHQNNINKYYYNFLSNNKLDIHQHIYHFKKENFSDTLRMEDKTILKENEKLWILTSWKYLVE